MLYLKLHKYFLQLLYILRILGDQCCQQIHISFNWAYNYSHGVIQFPHPDLLGMFKIKSPDNARRPMYTHGNYMLWFQNGIWRVSKS